MTDQVEPDITLILSATFPPDSSTYSSAIPSNSIFPYKTTQLSFFLKLLFSF